jgi:hypothetical protein
MNDDYKNLILENINATNGSQNIKDGCVDCHMVLDYEFDVLAKLQFDIYTDETMRKEVADEGGFCAYHFRQFKKIANGLTNILLLKTMLECDKYKKENYNIECRVCRRVNNYEDLLMTAQYELLKETTFRSKFNDSTGLCFEHFSRIISLCNNECATALRKIHIEQIERLQPVFAEMSALRSFYDIDREKRALINIMIEKFAGRKTHAL